MNSNNGYNGLIRIILRIFRLVANGVTLAVLIISCSEKPADPDTTVKDIDPGVVRSTSDVPRVDDELLLRRSPYIFPSEAAGDEFFFDFTGVDLVETMEFNDLEFSYCGASYNDMDVDVFNQATQSWDTLASNEYSSIAGDFKRTFLDLGLDVHEYVDDSLHVRFQAGAGTAGREYATRAFKVHDKYKPWSLAKAGVDCGRFDFDGQSVWMSGDDIFRLSQNGQLLETITTSTTWSWGMAVGRGSFWIYGGTEVDTGIYRLNDEGDVVEYFTAEPFLFFDMAFAGDDLWLIGINGDIGGYWYLQVNLDASLSSDTITVVNKFDPPGISDYLSAIASDGKQLFVAGEVMDGWYKTKIWRISFSGTIFEEREIDIADIRSMAWYAGDLWMIHTGPAGVMRNQSRYVVSSFRWR